MSVRSWPTCWRYFSKVKYSQYNTCSKDVVILCNVVNLDAPFLGHDHGFDTHRLASSSEPYLALASTTTVGLVPHNFTAPSKNWTCITATLDEIQLQPPLRALLQLAPSLAALTHMLRFGIIMDRA